MTPTITLPRATVEQALEALLKSHTCPLLPDDCEEAITALRAALAQQAEPQDAELSAALGWPGGISNPVLDRKVLLQKVAALAQEPTPPPEARTEAEKTAYAAGWWDALRKAQQAEPVPVAWMYTGIKQDGTEHGPHLVWQPEYMDAMSASRGAKATPLYTAPPRRPPLTEEEIDRVWDQWFGAYGLRGPGGPYTRRGFARAVERAHGITDHQVADRLARHGIPMPEGDPK